MLDNKQTCLQLLTVITDGDVLFKKGNWKLWTNSCINVVTLREPLDDIIGPCSIDAKRCIHLTEWLWRKVDGTWKNLFITFCFIIPSLSAPKWTTLSHSGWTQNITNKYITFNNSRSHKHISPKTYVYSLYFSKSEVYIYQIKGHIHLSLTVCS